MELDEHAGWSPACPVGWRWVISRRLTLAPPRMHPVLIRLATAGLRIRPHALLPRRRWLRAGVTTVSGLALLAPVVAATRTHHGMLASVVPAVHKGSNIEGNRLPRFTFDVAASPPVDAGTGGYANFTVASVYSQPVTVSFTVSVCSGSVVAGSCSVFPASITLQPGESEPVAVYFNASNTPGTVSVSVQASSGTTLTRSTTVTVNGVPQGTVTAAASSPLFVNQSGATSFTITNNGSATASVTPSPSCGGAIGSCSVSPAGTTSIGVGQSLGVTMSYTAGSAPGTGTATLSAVNAANGHIFSSASSSVTVNGVPHVMVMSGAAADVFVGQAGSTVFSISNDGTAAASVTPSVAACAGAITGCSASPSGTTVVGVNQSIGVTVSYTAGSTSGTGTTTLSAVDANTGQSLASSSTNVTVNGIPNATVTAGSASPLYVTQGGATQFTITNNGSATASVTPTLTGCGGTIGSCSLSPTGTRLIGMGQSLVVTVSYIAGSSAGTGTATLAAVNGNNGQTFASASISVPVSYPPVSIVASASPSMLNLIAGDHRTVTYTVTNNGSYPAYLTMTQKQCDLGACGAIQPALPSPLAVNQSVQVSFDYGATTGGSGGVAVSFVNAQAGGELSAPVVPVSVAAQVIAATLSPPTPSDVTLSRNQTGSWPFVLKNTGNVTRTITLAAVECSGGLVSSSCVPTPSSATLAGGNSVTINVAYQASAFGSATSGYVRVNAIDSATNTVLNQGVMTVTVPPPPVGGVAINLTNANQGTTLERSACLALPAGKDGDNECGDLRITHVLPATATLAKLRLPTLIYNSQMAQPTPQVYADVSLPVDQYTTQGISAVLIDRDNSTALTSGSWPVAGWAAGTTRRIMLALDGAGYATRIYHYRIEVTRSTTSGTSTMTSDTGSFAFVNRSSAMFPTGWWLAGVEQLYPQADGTILWVGGDGSTRQYVPTQSGCSSVVAFIAPAYTRPDTLKKDCVTNFFTRWLPNRARVTFDPSGNQVAVTNRHGQSTTYTWSNNQLLSISLPVVSGTAPQYTFQYQSGQGPLQAITAPAAGTQSRITTVGVTSNRLVTITDPDGSVESFGYDAGGRIIDHVDPRGFHSHYGYSGGGTTGSKLTRAASLISATDSATWAYTPQALFAATGTAPVIPDSAYTTFDGPRTEVVDISRFWLDRFGAPTRIANPSGRITQLTRADSRFPGLVTNVVAPNGYEEQATYDPRGNLARHLAINPYGDQRNPLTTYTWDPTWDDVTSITLPEGEVTTFGIDATTGNRIWEQGGNDPVRRANFSYYTDAARSGLLLGTQLPGEVLQDSVAYDAFGNVSDTWTPLRMHTALTRDAIGRVTRTTTPLDLAGYKHVFQDIVYDAMSRDTLAITWSDSSYAHDSLLVRKHFTPMGLADTIWTRSAPGDDGGLTWDRHVMAYDGMNRMTKEALSQLTPTEFEYDRAGNRTNGGIEGGSGLSVAYDALNRVTSRTVVVPYMGVPDTDTYGYDPTMGWLTQADNRYATIRRTYYPNGALRSDTMTVANQAGTANPQLVGSTHVFGLSYTYDKNGRRTALNALGTSQTYSYDPVTGDLFSITDPDGHQYTYDYDAAQRLKRVVRQAESTDALLEDRTYDADSRLTSLVVTRVGSLPATLRNDVITYDGRGKMVSAGPESFSYSPLGAVVHGQAGRTNTVGEDFVVDALGRILHHQMIGSTGNSISDFRYFGQTGHLDLVVTDNQVQPDTTAYGYDAWGNLTSTFARHNIGGSQMLMLPQPKQYLALGGPSAAELLDVSPALPSTTMWLRTNTFHQYDGFGLLYSTVMQRDTVNDPKGINHYTYETREKHHYDALGRRVWSGMIHGTTQLGRCATHDKYSRCGNWAMWIAWDGDQILREQRGTVAEFDTLFSAESPTKTVRYVHGGEMDLPIRGAGMYLFTSARGVLDLGDCMGGNCLQPAGGDATSYGDVVPGDQAYEPIWQGSLLENGRTGSGLYYRRNRYVDPASGSFTQTDPSGLAGGLNVYGFAGGDPVNYSDPLGLCPNITAQGLGSLECLLEDVGAGARSAFNTFAAGLKARFTETMARTAECYRDAVCAVIGSISPTAAGERTALSALMRDAEENPGNWRAIGAFTEEASSKAAKGGTSIQTILENKNGDRLVRHTVVKNNGEVLDDHYRPMYKPRTAGQPKVDVP